MHIPCSRILVKCKELTKKPLVAVVHYMASRVAGWRGRPFPKAHKFKSGRAGERARKNPLRLRRRRRWGGTKEEGRNGGGRENVEARNSSTLSPPPPLFYCILFCLQHSVLQTSLTSWRICSAHRFMKNLSLSKSSRVSTTTVLMHGIGILLFGLNKKFWVNFWAISA